MTNRLARPSRRLLAAPALLLAVILGGCSGTSAGAAAGAPTATRTGACAGVTVPVRIFKETPGQALAIVDVTLQDGNHYPFAIDTGASATSVSRRLAQTVGFASVGNTKLRGVNGVSAAPVVAVQKWAISGTALPSTRATVTDLPASTGGYVGLLGGDVLSTFGAIRLDYRLGRLTLGAPPTTSAGC